MRPFRFFIPSLVAGLVIAGVSTAPAQSPLTFTTTGGEAWTFAKTLNVAVTRGICDTVAIKSPLSLIHVHPQNGIASGRVRLKAGDNWVEADCERNGHTIAAPARALWRVRLRDTPTARIDATVGRRYIAFDAASSHEAHGEPQPLISYSWRLRSPNGEETALVGAGTKLDLRLPAAEGQYRLDLTVTDAQGRSDGSVALFTIHEGIAHVADAAHEQPAWISNAVVYGAVPKFFGRRGLADVAAALDRLKALGVNTLWLSPITDAPGEDFGYAVTDLFRLRPSVGSAADLHRLVEAAHARGMRVVLDFVANHVSDRQHYFVDAQQRGQASPYFDFFARDLTGAPMHYFGWTNLENLNYDNPEVRRLVIEAFASWVRRFDVDGFRVDAAWGPRQRDPDFWPRWRAELKRIKPDLLLLAEASARDPYYCKNGFDAAYDWTDALGQWAWQQAFAQTAQTARLLHAALAAPSACPVFRFLENNDTGQRFITRHGLARTWLAAALLMTVPGIPALFTGQEIGAAFEPYRQAGGIDWNGSTALAAWYAKLIALRHAEPSLHSPAIELLDIAGGDNVLAYVRRSAKGAAILVLLNFSDRPAAIELPSHTLAALRQPLIDLLGGGRYDLSPAHARITLAGETAMILKAVNREDRVTTR
ncbi:MAG TPA: alpha-amylase family glycosyl hydrolase [Pseudolabrys sp.]|nr:alpha-amylase family glycosyl hydrolase [Pseudolabrys sp.]